MTLIAGGGGMAFGKREERVVKPGFRPGKTVQGVTLDAVFRIAALHVVWVGGRLVIGLVTIVTLHPPGVETKQGSRRMALVAIGGIMRPDKRKPASLVNFIDVVYNPGCRSMTPAAVRPDRLVMHVGVTGKTFSGCLGKLE